MDKRKKVVRELRGLPICDLTGFPQHLGKDRWWNQVVVRLHAPRKNGCHHCHRMMDHRLSVSEFLKSHSSHNLDADKTFLSGFQIGMMVEMARVPPNLDRVLNEGVAFIIDRFKHQVPNCPLGQLPVMIGRRKRSYDTLDKVMKRLDLITNTISAMNFVVLDVHFNL